MKNVVKYSFHFHLSLVDGIFQVIELEGATETERDFFLGKSLDFLLDWYRIYIPYYIDYCIINTSDIDSHLYVKYRKYGNKINMYVDLTPLTFKD